MLPLPLGAAILLPGHLLLGTVGIIPIALGIWLFYANSKTSRRTCLNGLGAGAVLLVVTAFSGMAPWLSQAQESYRLAARARVLGNKQTPLATYNYFAPNLPFYARREVTRYHSPEEVALYFQKHPEGMLCVREDHWKQLADTLPPNLRILARSPRFFRTHNVLLLQGEAPTSADPAIRSAALPDEKTHIK